MDARRTAAPPGREATRSRTCCACWGPSGRASGGGGAGGRTSPRRVIPGALAGIERVVAQMQREDPSLQADVDVLQTGPPIETPLDAPLVRAAQEVAGDLQLPSEVVGY